MTATEKQARVFTARQVRRVYAQRSTAGILIQQFGLATDAPVPSAFVP